MEKSVLIDTATDQPPGVGCPNCRFEKTCFSAGSRSECDCKTFLDKPDVGVCPGCRFDSVCLGVRSLESECFYREANPEPAPGLFDSFAFWFWFIFLFVCLFFFAFLFPTGSAGSLPV